MKICGFQKLTLLDFPGRVACTVFTGGCNLRCPFCHNAGLVTELSAAEEFSEEEILSYLKKRTGVLDGVCITGGEPLLQPDTEDFLGRIKGLGLAIKLDTNGTYPERLSAIIDAGLCDYVAMDIKNSKERYVETVGIEGFDIAPVCKSVDILLSGKVPFEFRTTVVRELHTTEDIEKIALWIKGAGKYFLQNFVDSGNLIGEGLTAHTPETLEAMRKIAQKHIDFVELRGV
ncbi:MAG: anaerobic ribonucleoside-triphosphate reductase activating protein [Oscillospiraceae bacterium]|nr:anaerobic ribonucleoside-triphosphate reductase activating protein [Oscillospiraceae bacterium]